MIKTWIQVSQTIMVGAKKKVERLAISFENERVKMRESSEKKKV